MGEFVRKYCLQFIFFEQRLMIESVQATTACFVLLPVANAFGTGLCMMAILGFGRSASAQSFSTVRWSSG